MDESEDRPAAPLEEPCGEAPTAQSAAVHRRTSLSSVFRTVKERCSRDKLGSSEDSQFSHGSSRFSRSSRSSRTTVEAPVPLMPPRLEVLDELPQHGLHRSSTFRVCLEKAADDINTKYGTHPLPSHVTGRQNRRSNSGLLGDVRFRPIPPRSYFRRRDSQDAPGDSACGDPQTHAGGFGSPKPSPRCGVADCCRCKSHTGVPAHWVDAILETSLAVRNPPEDKSLHDISVDQPMDNSNKKSLSSLLLDCCGDDSASRAPSPETDGGGSCTQGLSSPVVASASITSGSSTAGELVPDIKAALDGGEKQASAAGSYPELVSEAKEPASGAWSILVCPSTSDLPPGDREDGDRGSVGSKRRQDSLKEYFPRMGLCFESRMGPFKHLRDHLPQAADPAPTCLPPDGAGVLDNDSGMPFASRDKSGLGGSSESLVSGECANSFLSLQVEGS